MFLLIMVPIAQEFNVPLTEVTAVFTITLWLRLVGATASGWLADRVGRKTPLMISILWYLDLQLHRRLLADLRLPVLLPRAARHRHGRGMAGRRLAGDGILAGALARLHESACCKAPGGSGFLLSSAAYGLLYDSIGWRGLLWIGVLPALVVVWVRKYVKEPAVWLENRKKQREQKQQVRLPLFVIFKRGNARQHADRLLVDGQRVHRLLLDLRAVRDAPAEGPGTLRGAGGGAADVLQRGDVRLQLPLGLGGGRVRPPLVDDHPGDHRVGGHADSICSPTTTSRWSIGFSVQGLFGGAIYGQNPSYLSERFPTEVRATAAGFCYHQGAIFGGLVAPVLTYIAVNYNVGFGVADDGRHDGRAGQLHHRIAAWAGDQGQGAGIRYPGVRA